MFPGTSHYILAGLSVPFPPSATSVCGGGYHGHPKWSQPQEPWKLVLVLLVNKRESSAREEGALELASPGSAEPCEPTIPQLTEQEWLMTRSWDTPHSRACVSLALNCSPFLLLYSKCFSDSGGRNVIRL